MKPYPHTFSGLPAVQEAAEFEQLLRFVEDNGIRSYLEIGVGRGDTFHEIVSRMPHGSRAVAVDLPEAKWGLQDSQKMLDAAAADLADRYDVTVIYGPSSSHEIIEQIAAMPPFDLVFIDGDHTMQGVSADFRNYGSHGRFVALHDIVDCMRPNRKREKIEVPMFWEILVKACGGNVHQFVTPGSNMGIGIIETCHVRS